MKIVINTCHGGFGLSDPALEKYFRRKNILDEDFCVDSILRNDPVLVEIVEEMGSSANGKFSDLKIVEVPDDVNWFIDDYDGYEWVAERHRTWR
jgi:hypothetical protein